MFGDWSCRDSARELGKRLWRMAMCGVAISFFCHAKATLSSPLHDRCACATVWITLFQPRTHKFRSRCCVLDVTHAGAPATHRLSCPPGTVSVDAPGRRQAGHAHQSNAYTAAATLNSSFLSHEGAPGRRAKHCGSTPYDSYDMSPPQADLSSHDYGTPLLSLHIKHKVKRTTSLSLSEARQRERERERDGRGTDARGPAHPWHGRACRHNAKSHSWHSGVATLRSSCRGGGTTRAEQSHAAEAR